MTGSATPAADAGFATTSEGQSYGGYDLPGGYDQVGYDQPGYDQPIYDQPGYDQPGYDQPGYGQSDYNQTGYEQPGYGEVGFDQPSHGEGGFDQPGYGEIGYHQTSHDQAGLDHAGFDQAGHDQAGHDGTGYEQAGHHQAGYGEAGYDQTGYDQTGYDQADSDEAADATPWTAAGDYDFAAPEGQPRSRGYGAGNSAFFAQDASGGFVLDNEYPQPDDPAEDDPAQAAAYSDDNDESDQTAGPAQAKTYGRPAGVYGRADQYGPDPLSAQHGWAPRSHEQPGNW